VRITDILLDGQSTSSSRVANEPEPAPAAEMPTSAAEAGPPPETEESPEA
jgi:hypothetical protein